jgi:hypothetical protein
MIPAAKVSLLVDNRVLVRTAQAMAREAESLCTSVSACIYRLLK